MPARHDLCQLRPRTDAFDGRSRLDLSTPRRADGLGALRAPHAVCSVDQLWTHGCDRARRAVWRGLVTPLAADLPCRVVELAGTIGAKPPSDRNQMRHVIAIREACSQEHAPYVNVDCNIAPTKESHIRAKLAHQELYRHCSL